jgi:hypothetical protein
VVGPPLLRALDRRVVGRRVHHLDRYPEAHATRLKQIVEVERLRPWASGIVRGLVIRSGWLDSLDDLLR